MLKKMKKMLKKIKLQQLNIFVACISFLGIMWLVAGCNESLQSVEASRKLNIQSLVPQASEIIQAGLADSDPRIRAKAIEIAAETKGYGFIPTVKKLLRDEFVPVRFLAAMAIGDLDYQPAKKDIAKLLNDDDKNVQMAAAYAAEKLRILNNSIEQFSVAIKSDDQTVRANAAFLLGKLGNKEALKMLHWARNDDGSDDKTRFQATQSIARLGDENIYPKLWTMLLSTYNDVRVMGIEAMGALGNDEARNALVTMLGDEMLEVRLAAAEQLGMLGETTGELEVLDVYQKNLFSGMDQLQQERAKARIAMAIAQIGTPELINHLPSLLKDKSKLVRLAAAKAVFQYAVKK